MSKVKKYIWNVLISIDQFGNTVLLAGDPDETISSNVGKRAEKGQRWAIRFVAFLEWIDPGHMERTIERDRGWNAVFSRMFEEDESNV